jgi:hypothetical protein
MSMTTKTQRKELIGYFFSNGTLRNGDGRLVVEGDTHYVKGSISPCHNGLHASPKPSQALLFTKNELYEASRTVSVRFIISKVKLYGTIYPDGSPQTANKWAASHRTYLKVRELTIKEAKHLYHLWGCGKSQYANIDRMIIKMLKD